MPTVVKIQKLHQRDTNGNKKHTNVNRLYACYHHYEGKGQHRTKCYEQRRTKERYMASKQQSKHENCMSKTAKM